MLRSLPGVYIHACCSAGAHGAGEPRVKRGFSTGFRPSQSMDGFSSTQNIEALHVKLTIKKAIILSSYLPKVLKDALARVRIHIRS